MISRRTLIAGLGTAALSGRLKAAENAAPIAETYAIEAPLDHDQPSGPRFPVRYGLLEPFDRRKSTVFVVADGQQFYVTPQAFAPSTRPIFDATFNVVGVFGRADAPEVQHQVGFGGSTDWIEAYRLLRADQWVGDLDAVRRALLGATGQIRLYGRSGGGLLVHQYASRLPAHVAGVFTQAAVNNFLEAEFGLMSDRFWEELTPADRDRLSSVLAKGAYARPRLAAVFQRQNFFVDRAHLAKARADLINNLARGSSELLEKHEVEYQVDALRTLDMTPRGPATHVRLFEFFAPVAAAAGRDDPRLRPDLEVSSAYAAPLMRLLQAGLIPPPTMDFAALADVRADIFLLAGRWDHTCDYRTQVALASCYRSHRIVIIDDDHTFHRLQASGLASEVVQGALAGFQSARFQTAIRSLEPLRWREGRDNLRNL